MENINDIDYRHGNNVFKKFKLKNLGEYHDLYVQSDTLLLADVFENFRNMCIKVYELITYENIRKVAKGQGDDYTTGCLLDYSYFADTYKMIAVDLSKQQALDSDLITFFTVQTI